jgi:hypothetical protein
LADTVAAALPVNTTTRASKVEILIARVPSEASSVCGYPPPMVGKQNLRLLMVVID